MPTLTLSQDAQILNTYPLKEDVTIKIGRSDQNDIILDESAVSNVHAEIEFDSDGFYITDIMSKNGTFVGRDLVISRKLLNGDIISIGSYKLAFAYKEGERRYDTDSTSPREATMVLDTSSHRLKLAKSLSELDDHPKKTKSVATLTFLDGSRDALTIDKPVTAVGKDSSCDIVVKGFLVPKTAAEIVHKTDGFYLRPKGPKSYPKLNYNTVKTEIKLNDFDVIEIGSSQFQFHLGTT